MGNVEELHTFAAGPRRTGRRDAGVRGLPAGGTRAVRADGAMAPLFLISAPRRPRAALPRYGPGLFWEVELSDGRAATVALLPPARANTRHPLRVDSRIGPRVLEAIVDRRQMKPGSALLALVSFVQRFSPSFADLRVSPASARVTIPELLSGEEGGVARIIRSGTPARPKPPVGPSVFPAGLTPPRSQGHEQSVGPNPHASRSTRLRHPLISATPDCLTETRFAAMSQSCEPEDGDLLPATDGAISLTRHEGSR